MYDRLWAASFAIFSVALVLGAAHAIILSAYRSTGLPGAPAWLRWLRRVANAVIVLGFLALSATIVARWHEAGYPPFSNMPESLLWMAWACCAVYFVSRLFVDFTGLEAAACVGVLGILAVSSLFPHAARPLMPALKSNWLIFHVLTCMIAYGAFLAAFLLAILWLLAWQWRETGKMVDALADQTMAFGFLLLTIGIVSGAIWARQAWGRYWGWDPKETWSLVTWLVYGIYLHFRLMSGSLGISRDRLPLFNALFGIVGFAVTMFTYIGVNYLTTGLHSYATR